MIDIRAEIISQLDEFYPKIPIYGEEIPQGFKEPSFYVKVLNGQQEKEVGRRYKRLISIDIHYFSTSNKEAERIAANLYEQMETLKEKNIRCSKMKHEVSDKVIHFFLDYNIHILKEKENYPKMNSLEVNAYGKRS